MQETDRCLAWVAARDDMTPTTYAELNAACEEPTMQWLTATQLARAASEMAERLTYVELDGMTLSPADVLAALVWRVSRPEAAPDALIPIRRPLGPVSEPHALGEAAALPPEAALAAFRKVDEAIESTGVLPARVSVNGLDLGPADVLRLAVYVMTAAEAEPWRLSPGPALPEIATTHCFQETRFNPWSCPEGFEPTYLSSLARWQSWTFRPAMMRS